MKELKENIISETVFRYRPNNTEHDFGEELTKAVNFHQIKCFPLSGQNDPFDSLPHYKMSSYEEILSYIKLFQQKHGTDTSFTGRNMREMAHENGVVNEVDIARFTSAEFLAEQAEQVAFNALVESRKSIKIACFSQNSDSILMWSHYANAHKGVCLEYDTRVNSEGRYSNPKLMKVDYSRARPKVTLLELIKYLGFQQMQDDTFCSKELSRQVLAWTHLSKSEEWIYENEWRWIDYDEGDPRYQIMLPMKVVSITVGAKASDKTIGLCVEIARGRIPVYQIQLSEDEFVFRRELVEIG